LEWALLKLNEECGELIQVIGKLIAMGGDYDHYDGSNLVVRMVEEMADVYAALTYVANKNLSADEQAEMHIRAWLKRLMYEEWNA